MTPSILFPYAQAQQVYELEPCARTFAEDLEAHLRNGWVLSTPHSFVMARPVPRNAPVSYRVRMATGSPGGPRRSFAAAAEAAGCKWATFHTMRHTFGSLHAQAGTPEIMIRRWMGITVETWNSHYAGLSPTDVTIENI